MNNQQLKYAKDRIDSIYRHNCNKVRDHYREKSKVLSMDEKLKALSEGRFSIQQPHKDSAPYVYKVLENFIVYEGEENYEVEVSKKMKELENERTRLLDELILGDEEKAFESIRAFAEFKVE